MIIGIINIHWGVADQYISVYELCPETQKMECLYHFPTKVDNIAEDLLLIKEKYSNSFYFCVPNLPVFEEKLANITQIPVYKEDSKC